MTFSHPPTASSREPHTDRVVQPPVRFRSQAFSTSQRFPSKLEFRGLVSCRSRSWVASLQSFPLAEIARPSRGRVLPCGHPSLRRAGLRGAFHQRFHRRPRFWRGGLAPPSTIRSLSTGRGPLPGNAGHPCNGLHALRGFTRFEALLPLRVRSRQPELPRTDGRCSPGLLPLQSALQDLGSSDRSPLRVMPRPEGRGAARPDEPCLGPKTAARSRCAPARRLLHIAG